MAGTQRPSGTAATFTATPDQHTRNDHLAHHRGKKANDPFLTRRLTAEVSKVLGQPSPGHADGNDTQDDTAHSLFADVCTIRALVPDRLVPPPRLANASRSLSSRP
jgi:hypothetical protein